MAVIRGTVVDANGQPVAAAAVYIISSPGSHADVALHTGADGTFALAAPAPGTYVLGARSDTAGEGRATVNVGASSPADVPSRIRLTTNG